MGGCDYHLKMLLEQDGSVAATKNTLVFQNYVGTSSFSFHKLLVIFHCLGLGLFDARIEKKKTQGNANYHNSRCCGSAILGVATGQFKDRSCTGKFRANVSILVKQCVPSTNRHKILTSSRNT